MSPNVADLEKRYAALSDEEFAPLNPADLTDVARECYNREAVHRGRVGGELLVFPENQPFTQSRHPYI